MARNEIYRRGNIKMGRLYSIKTTVSDKLLADTISSLLLSFRAAGPVYVREVTEDGKDSYEIDAVAPSPDRASALLREICPSSNPDIRLSTVEASEGMYEKSYGWYRPGPSRERSSGQWRLAVSIDNI